MGFTCSTENNHRSSPRQSTRSHKTLFSSANIFHAAVKIAAHHPRTVRLITNYQPHTLRRLASRRIVRAVFSTYPIRRRIVLYIIFLVLIMCFNFVVSSVSTLNEKSNALSACCHSDSNVYIYIFVRLASLN